MYLRGEKNNSYYLGRVSRLHQPAQNEIKISENAEQKDISSEPRKRSYSKKPEQNYPLHVLFFRYRKVKKLLNVKNIVGELGKLL